MINKYTKVITYKDIASMTQEYENNSEDLKLILETTDGCRLIFRRYSNLQQDHYMYEKLLQSNLEYDEVWKVVEQYVLYSCLIQREGYLPFQAKRLIEGELY